MRVFITLSTPFVRLTMIYVFSFFILQPVLAASIPERGDRVLYRIDQREVEVNAENRRRIRSNEAKSVTETIRYATELVNLAKQTGDPRYYGRADAVLAKTSIRRPNNLNNQLKLLKAEIAQFHHQFDSAIKLLDAVLESDPLQIDALLLRAQLYYASGDYTSSQRDCRSTLLRLSAEISATCFFMTKGLQKSSDWAVANAESILAMLQNESRYRGIGSPPQELLWVYSVLSDVLITQGQYESAYTVISQGLRNFPNAMYLLSNYADILLKQGRYEEVLNRAPRETNYLPLLVRLSAAESRLGGAVKKEEFNKKTRQIFKLESRRKQKSHFRERAMYEFTVTHDVTAAARYARLNWRSQKEPIDAKLLSLVSSGTDLNKNVIQEWISKNKLNQEIADYLSGDW